MNAHGPAIPPAAPLYNGRRQYDMQYAPPPPMQHPQPYHGYPHPHPHSVPQHFHPQHPPQWYQYHPMQSPMQRPYQPYPPTISSPYPIPQSNPPILHRPNPPQHAPSASSIRSSQNMLSPSTSTSSLHVPPSVRSSPPSRLSPPPAPPPPPTRRMPYYPPLPWYSVSEEDFPSKRIRRRRKRPPPQVSAIPVEFPSRVDHSASTDSTEEGHLPSEHLPSIDNSVPVSAPSGSATPTTSRAASDTDSTQPTTPSSAIPNQSKPKSHPTPGIAATGRLAPKILPIVPIVPSVPSHPRSSKNKPTSVVSEANKVIEPIPGVETPCEPGESADQLAVEKDSATSEQTSKAPSPVTKTVPKSWADLVRTNKSSTTTSNHTGSTTRLNGVSATKAGSLSSVISSFNVSNDSTESKIAFLEPRGLVNTGNMCYMNSVLQILVFCIPFYQFLDKVGKQAAFSFKSESSLMDAMILFTREFRIIDSAVSVEQLRMRLKDNELEQYGEAFIPEFVYEVIRRLSRFSTMRRGHQQDAEEFLGFLLEEMHDECVRALKVSPQENGSTTPIVGNGIVSPSAETGEAGENGWLEVGPRQKAAITRSSGAIVTESPITKIFGGKLRSELRVPGAKTSVTLEPYQPLQLDIGSPQVNNITDALKNLTRSEILHGDFNSPRGPGATATKQVFIETLPPVLILHLKRFQYDNAGGTQKIWKKVGYPLELEIPKEVFPQHKRGGLVVHGGLPKYLLTGVVYHHGKNAGGGHYTVDVRRQDGREWIRLDDTVIRRVRSEDVAEGGSEEDPKVLAAALEQHKRDQSAGRNIFEQAIEEPEEKGQSEGAWSQVNGTSSGPSGGKKWSSVADGTETPGSTSGKRSPRGKVSLRDNKVAYLLFYQKINI